MKKIFIGAFAALLVLSGCEKLKLTQKIEDDPAGLALVKIGYFMPFSTFNNKNVQLTFDGKRVGGLAMYAFPIPGGGFNTLGSSNPDYYGVKPGNILFSAAIPKVNTSQDSVVYFTSQVTLEADKRQTIMLTDTGNNAKATVITDLIQDPAPGNLRAKFFNGIPNVPAIDLYVTPTGGTSTLLAAGITYRSTSAYFEMLPATSLVFAIVGNGMPNITANQLATYSFASSMAGRVYTIVSRGYAGLPSTDVRRPMISLIVNR